MNNNGNANNKSLSARRAWIEIAHVVANNEYEPMSLSARRAWIEISHPSSQKSAQCVALRKESVDRNCALVPGNDVKKMSLSARRAWIEIPGNRTDSYIYPRRSPQGERG